MRRCKSSLSLAILCGGQSSRLKTDKGLYSPLGDETLVARAVRLWGTDFQEILVVVHDDKQKLLYQAALFQNTEIKIIVDSHVLEKSYPRCSLAGIFTAMAHSSAQGVVAVPVDQVGVHRQDLTLLLQNCDDQARCFLDPSVKQTLAFPSYWPKQAIKTLKQSLESGEYSVRKCLQNLCALQVEPSHISALKVNVNHRDEMNSFFGQPLLDRSGRRLHYLRFSLTEACNMSCSYCLPEGYPQWYRYRAKLNLKQVNAILRGFRLSGFRKVRFTGGEPTIHPHLAQAIQEARNMGFEQVAMTTNGVLIKNLYTLARAGLDQVNFSMDTLNPVTHKNMTKDQQHDKLLAVIDEALSLGLNVKINTVFLRSQNWSECEALIEWALSKNLVLRFIELMPTGLNYSFYQKEKVSGDEVLLKMKNYNLSPVQNPRRVPITGGPASEYQSSSFPGKIGLINPLSCNFCGDCNRLRVTARGGLRVCLFGEKANPLPLEHGPEAIAKFLGLAVQVKPDQHYLEQGDWGDVDTFRTIGG